MANRFTGQRGRAFLRGALKFWGIDTFALSYEKQPELIHKDFLEWTNSTNSGLVPGLGRSSVALTSGQAANLLTFPLAAGASVGFVVRATTIATDGTDMQAFTEIVQVACVNKAGTVTKTVTNLSTTGAKAVSAGTLTTTWALTDGTNQETLTVTATTSLTATTFVTYFEVSFMQSFTPATGYPAFA